MLAASRPYLLRILGANSVGVLSPSHKMNASCAHTGALPGKIAFVSQSAGMVAGILDWAKSRGIGFSKFISLGESADVDFGDVLDYLALDGETRAILLYMEAVTAARKFMSAARAAARIKPTLIVKAGRAPEAARAATSHTGAMVSADDIYDAAIRRAGMLRVYSTEDLFDAVETLARSRPVRGDRLAIVTNGGGPGVMATDALIEARGTLARASTETYRQLDATLPSAWSHGNPIDICGDASAERYATTMRLLLRDPAIDTVLFIHAPSAMVPSVEIASAVVPEIASASCNVLACWLGADSVAPARQLFSEAGIPTYDTPDKAVSGFMQIVQYHRNQALLMEVPPSLDGSVVEDRAAARDIVDYALANSRNVLSEPEAKNVLAAYGIPTVITKTADTSAEAALVAQDIGYPVALKILSPHIVHKSDVGGVVLDLENEDEVKAAAEAMLRRVRTVRPNIETPRFSVQSMARRPEGRELIIGVMTDPVFGPVVLFGQGGVAVEVLGDHAIGLPPLNMVLARDLISRTRVSKLLGAYRNLSAVDLDAVCHTLIQVGHLIVDIPEIVEMDINPLLADSDGVIALDARVCLSKTDVRGVERLAIRPYPIELEEWLTWQGEQLLLRPIKPEDGEQHAAFFHALDPQDVQLRTFSLMRELRPEQLARLTQIDYDRSMAFIAMRNDAQGGATTLGVSRIALDPDSVSAEFSIVVRSDMKRKGLGYLLMRKLIVYCKLRGAKEIVGETLPYNHGLLHLVRALGFETNRSPEGDTVLLRLEL